MIITCWYRDVGEGTHFNHISNGFHPNHDVPAVMHPDQVNAWAHGIWIGREARLVDGKVIGGELSQ